MEVFAIEKKRLKHEFIDWLAGLFIGALVMFLVWVDLGLGIGLAMLLITSQICDWDRRIKAIHKLVDDLHSASKSID